MGGSLANTKYTCAHNEIDAVAATGVDWFPRQQYRAISAFLCGGHQAVFYVILLLYIQG